MHRSGTKLLSQILKEIGVFLGSKVEPNGESLLFLKINERLLKQADSSWYNPSRFLLDIDNHLSDYTQFAVRNVEKYFMKQFCDQNFFGYYNTNFRWGWKDPRNILTIKIWKKIFPKAKIINIYRNPIDVANSLKKRETFFSDKNIIWWFYRTIYDYYKYGLHVQRCPNLLNINNGINLWEEYTTESLTINANILNIKYEDLVLNPPITLRSIVNFIEKQCSEMQIERAVKIIHDKSRYAFTKKTDLVSLYNKSKNSPLFIKTDYSNILNEI